MTDPTIYWLFVFAICLHNTEEALWLPVWSKHAKRFRKEIAPHEFHFAVLVITALAILSTSLFFLFPNTAMWKYIYFGFLGAMMINTLVPHLALTIILKRYMPGLITGLLLLVPVNLVLIHISMQNHVMDWVGLFVSTAIVGATLLLILPFLLRLGRVVKDYRHIE